MFHNCQNTDNQLDIMFIFDRCRRSSAAVTPVKYECDANNLTGTFVENFAYGAINERSLSNLHPWSTAAVTGYDNQTIKTERTVYTKHLVLYEPCIPTFVLTRDDILCLRVKNLNVTLILRSVSLRLGALHLYHRDTNFGSSFPKRTNTDLSCSRAKYTL